MCHQVVFADIHIGKTFVKWVSAATTCRGGCRAVRQRLPAWRSTCVKNFSAGSFNNGAGRCCSFRRRSSWARYESVATRVAAPIVVSPVPDVLALNGVNGRVRVATIQTAFPPCRGWRRSRSLVSLSSSLSPRDASHILGFECLAFVAGKCWHGVSDDFLVALVSGSGGTGRRTSLRGWRSQERGGSNPPFRTNHINQLHGQAGGDGTSGLCTVGTLR